MVAYHVSRWRDEPCINVSKVRAIQGARARVPVARASCVRARGKVQILHSMVIVSGTDF